MWYVNTKELGYKSFDKDCFILTMWYVNKLEGK